MNASSQGLSETDLQAPTGGRDAPEELGNLEGLPRHGLDEGDGLLHEGVGARKHAGRRAVHDLLRGNELRRGLRSASMLEQARKELRGPVANLLAVQHDACERRDAQLAEDVL